MLKAFTTLALLALTAGAAHAADLISDPPPEERVNLVSDPAWGLYVQGYGGIVTQSLLLGVDHFTFGDDLFSDLLNTGPAFGGSIGVTTPIDGLSFGLDAMHTHADFTTESTATLETLSIMGTIEGAYHLSPQFDVYASGGLGAEQFHYVNTDEGEDATSTWAPAYQVAVGTRFHLTENFSLFAEARHQDVFSGADIAAIGIATATGSTIKSKPNDALLVGARFSF